jgi:hypothetical protein
MNHYGRFLTFILGPGLIAALGQISYRAFESFVLGKCDSKLGCAGGLEFAAMVAAASFAFSAIGLILPAVLFRSTVKALPRRGLVLVVILLAISLAIMLDTVGKWPFEPFVPLFAAWAAASAVPGFLVLLPVLLLKRRIREG